MMSEKTDNTSIVTAEDLAAVLVKPDWAAMQPTRADLFRAAAGKPGLVQKVAAALLADRPDRVLALLDLPADLFDDPA